MLFKNLFIILFNRMTAYSDHLRLCLSQGPQTARQLADKFETSQPMVSRAITALGDEIVRIGAGRSIQYALRDSVRGLGAIPVYLVSADGALGRLGVQGKWYGRLPAASAEYELSTAPVTSWSRKTAGARRRG